MLVIANFNSDTDDIMEPVKEGFMTSFSAFMVCILIVSFFLSCVFQVTWIMAYSAMFH